MLFKKIQFVEEFCDYVDELDGDELKNALKELVSAELTIDLKMDLLSLFFVRHFDNLIDLNNGFVGVYLAIWLYPQSNIPFPFEVMMGEEDD